MFGLGRSKHLVADDEALAQRVEAEVMRIISDSWSADCVTLKESLGDPILDALPNDEFITHMRHIYAQMLGGTATRSGGGVVALLKDPYGTFERMQRILRPIREHLPQNEYLEQIYNSAYGSTSTNSVAAMVAEFNRAACAGRLKNGAQETFIAYLSAQWCAYLKTLHK